MAVKTIIKIIDKGEVSQKFEFYALDIVPCIGDKLIIESFKGDFEKVYLPVVITDRLIDIDINCSQIVHLEAELIDA